MSLNFAFTLLDKYPTLRKLRLYKTIKQIIIPLFLKYFSKFFKDNINNKLIVMSSIGGSAFIGNTKHLFEYLHENTDYELVWLSKSRDLTKELQILGYNVVNKLSIKTIKLLRTAKFIFTTHGISDVLPIEFSPSTIYVETWHGVQNKKNSSKYGPIEYPQRLTNLLRLNTINNKVFNYYITTSGTKKDMKLIVDYFRISPKKILATGYPRNDIFFLNDLVKIQNIKKKYNITNQVKRIILYAPTFRDNVYTAKLPLNSKDLMDLNNLLIDTKTILLTKAHMFEQLIKFTNFSNIQNVKKENDIQELLVITDILITDYSSIYCDFLLLDRPILFFTYDYEHFQKYGRGFYYDFEEIVPGPMIYSGSELINAIKNISEIEEKFKAKRLETRKIYHKYTDGKSSERILKILKII